MEGGSDTLAALDLDPPVVLLDNAIHHGQSQTDPFSSSLGCEKRLKNALQIYRIDSLANIRQFKPDSI